MNFNELKAALFKEAQAKKACAEGLKQIRQATDVRQLVTLFFKTLDFSIENDYPSRELRQAFRGKVEDYGVFLSGDNINVTNFKRLATFGNAKGKALYGGYSVGDIHARDESELNIVVNDNAFVVVSTADSAKVHITASGTAKVTIIKHGGIVTYDAKDAARITIKDRK